MTQKRVRERHTGMSFDAIKKWPGVRASTPSSSSGSATSSLLFMQALTWESTVESSSKFSFTGQSMQYKWIFMLQTAASWSPPKWGAFSGINCRCTSWEMQISEMASWVFCWFRKSVSSLISRVAPIKLDPWSLMIRPGLEQAIKASVDRYDTASMLVAFTMLLPIDTQRCMCWLSQWWVYKYVQA